MRKRVVRGNQVEWVPKVMDQIKEKMGGMERGAELKALASPSGRVIDILEVIALHIFRKKKPALISHFRSISVLIIGAKVKYLWYIQDWNTFTFESLPEEAVEEGTAVVAERRRHVVVHAEPVRHVDFEPLSQILETSE